MFTYLVSRLYARNPSAFACFAYSAVPTFLLRFSRLFQRTLFFFQDPHTTSSDTSELPSLRRSGLPPFPSFSSFPSVKIRE